MRERQRHTHTHNHRNTQTNLSQLFHLVGTYIRAVSESKIERERDREKERQRKIDRDKHTQSKKHICTLEQTSPSCWGRCPGSE